MPTLNLNRFRSSTPLISGSRPCACATGKPIAVRLGLRSQVRPVFGGFLCCGPACLERAVSACVRREMAMSSSGRQQHRHRMPLGLLLLSRGSINQAQLQQALDLQRSQGGRLGDLLRQMFGLGEDDITAALSSQWNCPVWAVRGFDAKRMASLAPRAVLEMTGLVPLRRVGGERLYVTSASAIDASGALALERMHGISVECGVSNAGEVEWARKQLLEAEAVCVEQERFQDERDLTESIVRVIRRMRPVESRLVQIHGQFWLRLWLEPAALLSPGTEDVRDVLFTAAALVA